MILNQVQDDGINFMPELPEVETLKRDLKIIKGKTIALVKINWPKMVMPLSVRSFTQRVKGKKIVDVIRRAKVLFFKLSNDYYIAVHLKMTGQLIFQPKQGSLVVGGHPQKDGAAGLPNNYTHVVINFTDESTLFFNDLRKFGWMRLIDQKDFDKFNSDFGIEPLSQKFKFEKFSELLKRYPNRKIKQTLMDHTLISGIGNIYADESCYDAKILPSRVVKTLKPKEIKSLHDAIKKILKLAIVKKGTSFRNYLKSNGRPGGMVKYLKVYGRANQTCQRCQTPILKIKQNGRGTHFCPKCQH
ncbi:MAG: DNA-formamidopyrimidine glycosylase [Patescibacteria group bacterium]|nr:DNA-formamidopyrimidine glycosylase [Patescibacteria group bacterium]